MVVVAIVAVLAALATYGVSKYVSSSKTSEAVHMISTIKAAQETYKDETFTYLDVSGSRTLTNYYPVNATPGQSKVQWGGTDVVSGRWSELGVNAAGPVLFVYACAAGAAADAFPAPGADITITNWPAAQTAPWYIVKAYADLASGGDQSVFVGASFTSQLVSQNAGE